MYIYIYTWITTAQVNSRPCDRDVLGYESNVRNSTP